MKSISNTVKAAVALSVLAGLQVLLASCATTTTTASSAEDAVRLKKVQAQDRRADLRDPAGTR